MRGNKDDMHTQMGQLELIYRTAPMGIALLNEKLEFITCNPALQRKLGLSLRELRTKTILELCHPWDRNKTENIIKAARQQNSHYLRDEIRLAHTQEPYLWVEISVQHISEELDTSGSYVVMVQNIQKRKEMQLEVLELRRRLMESNEIERKKIAQDLHDGPMQDLHSISYQIAGMSNDLEPELKEFLESILKTVSSANRDLRAIAYNLRPPALSKFGLARSIKAHADEQNANHPELDIKLDLVSDRNVISEEISLALFRIYQQSLANIIRHANATEVIVVLALDGDSVTMEISDNGKGFTVPDQWISLVRAGHYGLAGTVDRVNSLGGEFDVESAPGEGTRVFVQIPDYME